MQAHKRKIVYAIGFLFSIAMALTSYINSSFLQEFIDEKKVSLIYIISSLLTVILLLGMPKLLNIAGNYKTSILFLVFSILAFWGLAFGESATVIIPAFMLYFISVNFFLASLDIFIEDFSTRKGTGGIRGMYLLSINFAWVVAQLLSGSIIAKSSWSGIYIFASGFIILAIAILAIFLHDFKDPKYRQVPIIKTLRTFLARKNLLFAYLTNLLLKFFFAWMIIYTPIYLNTYMEFSWSQIGIIFSIMLLPFVILDYPLGKISDKIGEKKILVFGFLISAFFTTLIPFITEPKIWLWAGVLFMTRVGAASIEVMSESYFFKNVEEEDDDEISFFRNTTALSFVIAPLAAILVLSFVPSFKFIFPVLGAILFSGALIALRLKDVR